MSHHDLDDVDHNTSKNEHFQNVLDRGLQSKDRRNILRGGVGLAAAAYLPWLSGCGGGGDSIPTLAPPSTGFSFFSVGKSIADQVIVPAGYNVTVLHATGDRLDSSLPVYSNAGIETDDWERRIGDHHDGMDIFYVDANGKYSTSATSRALLAVNHESSADAHFFHPNGQTSSGVSGKKYSQFGDWDLGTRPELESLKEINHHGISIVELSLDAAGKPTGYVLDSALNRRVTPSTLVEIRGPQAHLSDIRSFMVTKLTLPRCRHRQPDLCLRSIVQMASKERHMQRQHLGECPFDQVELASSIDRRPLAMPLQFLVG